MLAPSSASGYYHFVHYLTRSGPYTQVLERFDINVLPGKTLQYVISDQLPTQLAAGDSAAAVVSQIRLAAQAWNDAPGSDLRLAFGGIVPPGDSYNAPVIEVVFGEVPPGLIAYGGPTVRIDASATGGAFTPILRSTITLRQDLSQRPSWTEGFYLSVAHEFGHAVGLQHSMTSSLMSTEITRGTTKSKPLAADDIAGISLLYPKPDFALTTGTISGRVSIGTEPAHMASVVALSADGGAISALSNPDGTYRIDGLPPGSYYVYTHPLPPATPGVESYPANIFPPLGPDGQQMPALSGFETVFYPGVKDSALAAAVVVQAGSTRSGVDFGVGRRTAPAVYAVRTYSFPGSVAVMPAHLSTGGGRNFILATGAGLTPQAGVSVIGGAALIPAGGVKPYAGDPRYVQLDFQLNLISGFNGDGPRHLTFSTDNDVYVLPSAFRLVRRQPPQINSLSAGFDGNGSRQVTLEGANFTADTRVLFDGVPGIVKQADEFSVVVTPPPAPSGHRAAVVALNADGQSSLFLQANPTIYEFDFADQPSITANPSQLGAGTEAMLEIIGSRTNFDAQATVALGSPDVSVRRVWVVGPNRLLANVLVSPQANLGAVHLTVSNGLRLITMPSGVQIGAANPRQPQVRGPVIDAVSGNAAVAAGGQALIAIVSSVEGSVQVTVNERAATAVSFANGQLRFQVPRDLQPGPAVVRIVIGGEAAPPIVMQIDQQPPAVTAITVSGQKIDSLRPARPGELITLSVTGLGAAGEDIPAARVRVLVAIFSHPAVMVTSHNGGHQVQFVLDPTTGPGSQSVSVSIDGRGSEPVALPVRAN